MRIVVSCNKFLVFLFLFLNAAFSFQLWAQKGKIPLGKDRGCIEITNKKALKAFEAGTDKGNDKRERMEALRKAMELQPNFAEANYLYADELIKSARLDGTSFKPAEKYLEKTIESCPEFYAYAYFYLGQIQYGQKEYAKAYKNLQKSLDFPDDFKTDDDYMLAKNLSAKAKVLADIFDPKPFDPKCVEGVSSKDDEYLAVISPDNEIMLYTRKMMERQDIVDGAYAKEKIIERFSYSNQTNGFFDQGNAFASPFNKGENYGGATITTDNKKMYITVCAPKAIIVKGVSYNYNNCDIYESVKVNGMWSDLVSLGPNINTETGWEGQPSISADGQSLYFATFRKTADTLGGLDIYRSIKNEKGEWSPAQNLGSAVNTPQNEKSPFVHSDSETLYFSSDGHLGVGGFDIFYTKADETGKWKKPKNIGFPINSENDEVGFFVSLNGKTGYFSSNSLSSKCKGGYDIYAFDLYKEARPEAVALVKGNVKDDKGQVPENTQVEIKNASTQKVTKVEVDKNDGQFAAIVKVKKEDDLVLSVKSDSLAFNSQLIKARDNSADGSVKLNLEVKKLEVGTPYKINNINFGLNSSELMEDSKYVLNEFAEYLKQHESLMLAIHGHTDNLGKEADNMALSTDRAFSVMGYLQDKGVSAKRLQFQGFGSSKPVVPNDSDANRAKNRRTEFVIVSK
jgi:outer membrane protein OmpA-like peptidoglycan-associated protein/tetratricopeptide (TPR) repeat protein